MARSSALWQLILVALFIAPAFSQTEYTQYEYFNSTTCEGDPEIIVQSYAYQDDPAGCYLGDTYFLSRSDSLEPVILQKEGYLTLVYYGNSILPPVT